MALGKEQDNTAAKPITRPADKSVPVVIKIPEIPNAIMKRGVTFDATLATFAQEKKLSLVNPTNKQ